jgi:hypothetical protein
MMLVCGIDTIWQDQLCGCLDTSSSAVQAAYVHQMVSAWAKAEPLLTLLAQQPATCPSAVTSGRTAA